MHKLLIIVGLFFSLAANAQFKISGKVTSDGNNPISFVTIRITDAANKTKISQTDSLGFYELSLKADKYTLAFSALGYETVSQTLHIKQETTVNIQLNYQKNNLADVQINAKKPLMQRKIDRTVMNVENSVLAIGTDALELLSKIPGVRVMNDKVSLVGKGGVNVMVNDKLIQLSADDLANYLRSIASSNIAKIEMITNPPAKYDAQGNNGLINIVLKGVNGDGFKGAVNAGFNQASHATATAGGNLSFRKDKLTLYANLNIRKGSLVPFEQSNIFYPNQTWNIVNKDRNFRTVPSGQIGLDYQLAKQTTIGLSYGTGLTNFHSEENIKTKVYNQAQGLDSLLNSDAHAKINSHYQSANIYFKQNLDSLGKQITFNGDWFKFNDDRNRFFNNNTYLGNGEAVANLGNGEAVANSFAEYLSSSKQKVDLYTLKVDVDLPYKPVNVSLGTKFSFINNESDVAFYKSLNDEYILNAAQSNLFNYKENIQALYLNLNKNLKKWDFQIGLRAEFTQLKGISQSEDHQSTYFMLFPTAYLSFKLSDKSVFSASYGRRINRPPYKKLNPFRWYSNHYAYAEGNPDLQPSYHHNIEIAHVYASVFSTVFSFNNTVNGYTDVNFISVATNTQILKPINFLTGYNYQLSNSITFNQLKWLESINQVDIFYTISKSNIPETLSKLKGCGGYLSTTNQFILNASKTFFGDASFWYQFPTVDGLSDNKSQCNLSLGVKALFLDKKLQLAINMTDVLKTDQYRYSNIINNIHQTFNNYYDNRQLRLTARYNFGNDKIKTPNRKAGNEEERKRNN